MHKLTPKSARRQNVATTSALTTKATGAPSLSKTPSRSTPDLLHTAVVKASTTPIKTKMQTPKFNPKATAFNACYTPSSLYGRSKTPTSLKINVRAVKTQQQTDDVEHDDEMSQLQVAVRVRPLNAQECARTSVRNIVRVQANELTVHVGSSADASAGVTHTFNYDHVFNSSDPEHSQFATQHRVFLDTAQPLIERALQGYNACLFAYGPTGSGKSYSMMGVEALEMEALDGSAPQAETGIIPRFCYELFKRIDDLRQTMEVEVEISYFEIYNEKIHDLLSVEHVDSSNTPQHLSSNKAALKVREHPMWGPYVVDLSVHTVNSYKSLRNWIAVGNAQRATAATSMNDKSSRSHAIFNIVLVLTDLDAADSAVSATDSNESLRQTKRSKISLVDLAGSERLSASGNNCERMREGVSINKSLLTLGKVIAALADGKKNGCTHVPYRDSVLTWLLRENLGGNSRTVMLATISPASTHIDDTLATLRYASQAKTIVNRVKVNESPHDKIIRELRAEVERLKSLRNDYERQKRLSSSNNNQNLTPRKIIIETTTVVDDAEVESLRQQLAEREKELQRAEKSWMERLKEAENRRKSEVRMLRKKGLAMELSAEQKHACLVNLTADPVASGTLFYILPPGVVKVGRTRITEYASQPDIELNGETVAYYHCEIVNEQEKLFIEPLNTKYETHLNGELVLEKRQMFHGDRLVIGAAHFFRIANPYCSKKNEQQLVDYQYANKEILQKQEQKMRQKLKAEQRAALAKIEKEHEQNYKKRMEQLECKYKNEHETLEAERHAMEEFAAATAAIDKKNQNVVENLDNDPFAEMYHIMLHPTEKRVQQTIAWVKEANELCRKLSCSLEFEMSQKVDEFGLTVLIVIIWDKQNRRKAKWPVARLHVWLKMMHSERKLRAENMFEAINMEWLPFDSNDRRKFQQTPRQQTQLESESSVCKKFKAVAASEKSPTTSDTSTCQLSPFITRRKLAISERKKLPIENDVINEPSKLQDAKETIATEAAVAAESSNSYATSFGALMKLFSPRKNSPTANKMYVTNVIASRTPTRRLLNFDSHDEVKTVAPRTDTVDCKYETISFYALASANVREMQRVHAQLKRLCEQAAENRENLPIDSGIEKTLNDGVQNIDCILHNMRACLQQKILASTVGGGNDDMNTQPSRAVKFLVD